MPTICRVIVGASGSPGSLRALRYAQHLARDFDATLMPVLAWLPPGGELADRRTPNEELRRIWAQDAHQKLQDALNLAWGTPPATCRSARWSGAASPARSWPTPPAAPATCWWSTPAAGVPWPGSAAGVSHYCQAHAWCPVLTVPPPPLAHQAPRGALARAFWHRTLTTGQIPPGKRGAAA